MKNRRKIILLIFIFILIVGVISLLFSLNNKANNKKLLKDTKSLVTTQKEYEKDFSTKGYTIDNPNIILDPYKSSPLTALIMFETDSAISPKVTIIGKDKNTTFSHSFEKTKKHYLSIYGL